MEASAQGEEDTGEMRDTLKKPDDETVDTEAGNDRILN